MNHVINVVDIRHIMNGGFGTLWNIARWCTYVFADSSVIEQKFYLVGIILTILLCIRKKHRRS